MGPRNSSPKPLDPGNDFYVVVDNKKINFNDLGQAAPLEEAVVKSLVDKMCPENWTFLKALADVQVKLQKEGREPATHDFKDIIETYIRPKNKNELYLNIPSSVINAELKKIDSKTEPLTFSDFEPIAREVQSLLTTDFANVSSTKKADLSNQIQEFQEFKATKNIIAEQGDVLKRQISICDTYDLLKKSVEHQKSLLGSNKKSGLTTSKEYDRFRTLIEASVMQLEKRMGVLKDLLGQVDQKPNDDIKRHLILAVEDLDLAKTRIGKFNSKDNKELMMRDESVSSLDNYKKAAGDNVEMKIDDSEIHKQLKNEHLEKRIAEINPTANAKPWEMEIDLEISRERSTTVTVSPRHGM